MTVDGGTRGDCKTRRLSSDGATEHKSGETSAPKERVSIHPNDLK